MNATTNIESSTGPNNVIALPADLMGEEPEVLRQTLLSALARGRTTVVDASQVGRLGTAALQVLLAFLREAVEKGVPVELLSPSRAVVDALHSSGLARDPLLAGRCA